MRIIFWECYTSTRVNFITSVSRSKPSGNTKTNRILRPPSSNQKNKVEKHHRKVKSSLNKTNSVSEPIINTLVKHSVRNAKFESICAICNKCLFDANNDMCRIDYVNDVNKPTRRIFTIVGNRCPLTRLTSANVVPLKETTIAPVIKPTSELKVYSRRPKASRSIGSSSKSKIVNLRILTLRNPNNLEDPLFLMFHLLLLSIAGCPNCSVIMGYGDYQMGNVTISWVYYVEGLGHNLFSVRQFCDSDLEVAFRIHTCFIRDLEGADLLKGSRGSNLYTLSLENMLLSFLICLLFKTSKTKSWLWHRRLSHLNFDYITSLAKQGLVRGLPKLKYQKDHLSSSCALGKSKKLSHKPKAKDFIQEKLYLLHMDLCGPMRIQSINGRIYILVIVDDYSRFTWVKFLRSKDEVPEFVIKFLKMIQVRLNATVRNIRTDNGTEFVNQTLKAYYEEVKISHQTSVAHTPQQNGVVERRNRTLVEAARTMLIFSKAPKPDLSYLHVFGALYCPTNDSEDLGKLQPKADIGIFVGYAPAKKAFRIYNKRTRMIIETIHVDFDELTAMASEQFNSGPEPKLLTSRTIIPVVIAPEPAVSTVTPSSTIINQDAPSISSSQTTPETPSQVIRLGVEEADHDIEVVHMDNNSSFDNPIPKPSSEESSSQIIIPDNLQRSMTESSWIDAMQEVLNEFERLEVWELVPRPDRVIIITLKWIYKVKLDELGGVLNNKARLVARGYPQEEGINFEKYFATVA
ncbi:retrovirus-related pol polyprotein from transposon TNT 1-94 [Tanacetum coccineum]